jgi:hypothetical protein
MRRLGSSGSVPRQNGACPFQCRCGKGTSGQAAALRWCGRRNTTTSLRCSVSRPRRITHYANCVRCVQTDATSQLTTRAAREATSPALLGAPEAHCSLPERAFARTLAVLGSNTNTGSARQAVPGGGDFCDDEKRTPEVGARSALRELTRRSCLSVESAANEASSATRLQGDAPSPDTNSPEDCLCLARARASGPGRSGAGAQRRPSQHELPLGTACRASLVRNLPSGSGGKRPSEPLK